MMNRGAIGGHRHPATLGRWNARRDVPIGECRPEPVAVVASVSNERRASRQRRQDETCALVVAQLPFEQQKDERSAHRKPHEA